MSRHPPTLRIVPGHGRDASAGARPAPPSFTAPGNATRPPVWLEVMIDALDPDALGEALGALRGSLFPAASAREERWAMIGCLARLLLLHGRAQGLTPPGHRVSWRPTAEAPDEREDTETDVGEQDPLTGDDGTPIEGDVAQLPDEPDHAELAAQRIARATRTTTRGAARTRRIATYQARASYESLRPWVPVLPEAVYDASRWEGWPDAHTIKQAYGDWDRACAAAWGFDETLPYQGVGNPTPITVRNKPRRRWTDAELRDVWLRFLAAHPGRQPTIEMYDAWRRAQLDTVPTRDTLIRRAGRGSWPQLVGTCGRGVIGPRP